MTIDDPGPQRSMNLYLELLGAVDEAIPRVTQIEITTAIVVLISTLDKRHPTTPISYRTAVANLLATSPETALGSA